MNTSKLKFIYAYPLDVNQKRQFESEGKEYPLQPEILDTIINWHQLWEGADKKYKIIEVIAELTRRVPERNLECFVYGAGINAMSTPFLMPIKNRKGNKWTDEYFLQTIIHEMLHIFLITNTDEYWEMVHSEYSSEESVCQNHIILYAMLSELYKKCFGIEPPDFRRDNMSSGYARAIDIVKEKGSKVLIEEYNKLVLTAK